MAIEIERKFLLEDDSWRLEAISSVEIVQAYIFLTDEKLMRIRLKGEQAILSIKAKTNSALIRLEYEYEIPKPDALEMIEKLAEGFFIRKIRHFVQINSNTWEIDEFLDENHGLVIAEIEMNSEDQELDLPQWIGDEVTNDSRYINAALSQKPYRMWN